MSFISRYKAVFALTRRVAALISLLANVRTSRRHLFRFYFRTLIYLPASVRWFNFLGSDKRLYDTVRACTFLAEKIHRPYFRADYSANERFKHLKAHYSLALTHPIGTTLICALYEPMQLASIAAKDGSIYQVVLTESDAFRKEGELLLEIRNAQCRLYSLAFSFNGTVREPCLKIGCVQGPRQSAGPTAVKLLTRNTHGIYPYKIMICAAQAVAKAFEANSILGVGNTQHVYRNWRNRREIKHDYDSMWRSLGGEESSSGEFLIPLTFLRRPVTEYPSKKRAEIRRRHELMDALTQSIYASLKIVPSR